VLWESKFLVKVSLRKDKAGALKPAGRRNSQKTKPNSKHVTLREDCYRATCIGVKTPTLSERVVNVAKEEA
jgi:hypothetical protein